MSGLKATTEISCRWPTAATSLEHVKLDQSAYDADVIVNDRAQVFTTEIVRLGLLAIAAVGFILAHPIQKDAPRLGPPALLWATLLSLGGAVGAALAHRYYSTDCIVCQMAILRLISRSERSETPQNIRTFLAKNLERRRDRQERDMTWCRWLTRIAAMLLGAGALGMSVIIALTYAS